MTAFTSISSRAFLQPKRMHDWRIPSNTRLQQAMNGLKKAQECRRRDGSRRGRVYDMDDEYGNEGLELDLKKLFRPIAEGFDNPTTNRQA